MALRDIKAERSLIQRETLGALIIYMRFSLQIFFFGDGDLAYWRSRLTTPLHLPEQPDPDRWFSAAEQVYRRCFRLNNIDEASLI